MNLKGVNMLHKSKLENVTVGADPEVFVANHTGTITSAIGNVGGSKDFPRTVTDGGVQEDNVLAEFNINPASNKIEFLYNMNSVMSSLKNILENKDLQPVIIASHMFDKGELESYGPMAMEFGCSAEWNAWSGREIPRPQGSKVNLRTAGGHVHVGYDDPNKADSIALVKMLDFVLGLPSIEIDPDNQRRKLYGKAGSMRYKPYGVEYRSLSNFWLSSDDLMSWVYDTTLWATSNLGMLPEFLELVDNKTLNKVINKSDKQSARAIIDELGIQRIA